MAVMRLHAVLRLVAVVLAAGHVVDAWDWKQAATGGTGWVAGAGRLLLMLGCPVEAQFVRDAVLFAGAYWTWSTLLAVADGSVGHITGSRKRRRVDDVEFYGAELTDEEFNRTFRVSRALFKHILDTIGAELYRDAQQARRSSAGPISEEAQLAMTLRWLAGCSYLDMRLMWGVHSSTFYQVVWRVVNAILLHFPISFPTLNEDKLREMANDFEKRQNVRHRVFHGVVGALDGLLVKIRCPRLSECINPRSFWCRKGFYALNAQAVCDARRKFVFFATDCPGSNHDSTAWNNSTLCRVSSPARLREACVCGPLLLVGNGGKSDSYVFVPTGSTPLANLGLLAG